MKGAFSPTGIAITAIVAGLAVAKTALDEATEETKKYAEETKRSAEELKEEKNVIDELRSTIDNNTQTRLTEIENTKDLWQELQKITDENGKIKKGYEKRAEVITGKLSEALGTEISITDDVIDKYKDLQKEVDTLILKKQAEAILNGYEEKYNNAISNRTQKTQELLDKQDELTKAKKKEAELYDEYNLEEGEWQWGWETSKNYKNWKNQTEAVKNLEKEVSSLQEIVDDYTGDIENYRYNFELYTEGTTESIQKMIDETGKTYIKNGETVRTTYQNQIKEQQTYLNNAKLLNKEAVDNNNETEMKKTQDTIDNSNKRLYTLAEELIGMTSATNENSEDIKNAWKALATSSYEIYAEKIKQMTPEMQSTIQEITGVIVTETPNVVDKTNGLADEIIASLDTREEARTVGLYFLKEYLNGLEDEEQRRLLTEAGIDNVEAVMKGLKEGDLSEQTGVEILKGLGKGLDNQYWKNEIFGKAKTILNNILGTLNITTKISSLTGKAIPGHKDGLDYVPYDNYIARLHKGERVLTAEENKNYMADNIENKITNRNIVVQFYPQTMTEQELKRAENYIAKKWGMAL